MLTPLISIIVPCYNQAIYLDECLQSVLSQTFKDWECIIVNDGSPDNTGDMVTKWLDRDERFKYISKKNEGVSAARNTGVKAANGTWILPLDADDKISPEYLMYASAEFHKNPQIVYCNAEYFGKENGKMVLQEFNKYNLLIENHIFCTSFFKKKDWETVGGFDENMLTGYEDWELWINFISHFGNINVIRLDYHGMSYRIKADSKNISAKKDDLPIKQYIAKKHFNLYLDGINHITEYFHKVKSLQKENLALLKIVSSKRFKFLNKVLGIIKL